MNNNKIIYSLNTEDIQIVANQELDRDLTKEEINSIEDLIAEKINWYDAIAESISKKIK
jgi:hypothetical protein